MTMEALINTLAAEGWRVWHVGETSNGSWASTLFTDGAHPAVQDMQNRTKGGYVGGFSRRGLGNSMASAIRDAARDILPEGTNAEDIDVDFLLS